MGGLTGGTELCHIERSGVLLRSTILIGHPPPPPPNKGWVRENPIKNETLDLGRDGEREENTAERERERWLKTLRRAPKDKKRKRARKRESEVRNRERTFNYLLFTAGEIGPFAWAHPFSYFQIEKLENNLKSVKKYSCDWKIKIIFLLK